jgi:putative redox protein
MEVTVEHLGAVQFEIKARQHSILSDQPPENFGHDEGMTPPELLLASLGSCAAFYAAQYLRKHKLAAEGTRVRVVADKVKDPARVDNFRIEIDTPVELNEQHRAGVEASVHHCLIHNTLLHPPKISIEVRETAAATH